MENKGLLFIPDISGFTRFATETEIEHSRLIIQELLEILINANSIGLEVSEIEGDAILFYKYGDPPPIENIYRQVEQMFCAFHRNLFSYDATRYCQCKACTRAVDLTLKVITHYGEFTGYSVQQFHKLIGKDIIIAHQLLKNDISEHEYWLVTKNLVRDGTPSGITEWMQWNSSAKQTETGEVPFHFTQLGPLKTNIASEPMAPPDLSKKQKVISLSHEYETGLITLFHATGDFNHRSCWMEGVKKVEEVNHYLPRVGMKCKKINDDGNEIIYSSSYYYTDEQIEFSETEENSGNITYFTLRTLPGNKTALNISYYTNHKFPDGLLFRIFHKKEMENKLSVSMKKLEGYIKTMSIL